MHLTKAGGSTVEWILRREARARNYTRAQERKYLYGKEVPLSKLGRNSHLTTMLREPLARFSSYVHFRRYDIKSKYQRHGRNLLWSAKAFSNLYARMLTNVPTGVQYSERAARQCRRSKSILSSKFAVVGTSERMLETMAAMGYVFQFKSFPLFGRINQQIGAPDVSELPKSIKLAVKRMNRCDENLFKTANLLLDKTIECLGSDFQEYLREFKAAQEQFMKDNPGCLESCVMYGKAHRSGKIADPQRENTQS